MFVYLTFHHNCPAGCPYSGQQTMVQIPMIDNSAYAMPDVRCVRTNVQLTLFAVNGVPVV